MSVTITKSAINIREKLSELDKPSGIAGEAVLRADSVQEIRSQIGAGRKNLIINGGMDVWQRPSSVYTSHGYNADRWVSNQTDMSKSTSVYGGYSWMLLPTNGYVHQRIEGNETLRNKTVAVSFLFRDAGAAPYAYFYYSTVQVNPEHSTITDLSGGIKKYQAVFTLPDSTNTDGYLKLYLQAAGATAITHVQLEEGSVATDFEHRSYGEELALCQRYFYNAGNDCILFANANGNAGYSGRERYQSTQAFPTVMRAAPTIVLSVNGGSGGSAFTLSTQASPSTLNVRPSVDPVPVSAYWYGSFTAEAEL